MYGNTGRAVRISGSNEVILSPGAQGVSTFLLVACRRWDTISAERRPACISLMDADRPDWYVRHNGASICVEL